MSGFDLPAVEALAKNVRRDILEMARECGTSAHLGGALSMAEILAVLYGAVLRHEPRNPEWEERDRFILSKGHGVLAYYAALAECGYFSKKLLNTFQKDETELGAHPVMAPRLGIESSNGSLGQGLSFGVGLARAALMKGRSWRVFVLLGNGECNEGSVWEAIMSAAQFGLENLVAIIDNNGQQSDGDSRTIIGLTPLDEKFRAFGWQVRQADGHNPAALHEALAGPSGSGCPLAVIAATVKGKGVSFMENDPQWHHNRLTAALYEAAAAELEVS